MKKTIGILGVVVFTAVMFLNTNTVNGSSSDTSLANLLTLNSANAECVPSHYDPSGHANKFDMKDKPIVVIIYDEELNYLGETDLGSAKECHWENAFVSKEGLNIEWIKPNDIDEDFLTLKIFVLKKIKKES